MKGALPGRFLRWRARAGRLDAASEPAEAPGPGEVVLRVEGCTLGPAEVAALADDGACPGSASVGEVVAASDELGELVGRRLLVPEALPCGECPTCQRGRGPACPRAIRPGRTGPGALASHLRVPGRSLGPADGELAAPAAAGAPWLLAAVAGPAARIYHALVRAGVGPGELCLFVGPTAESRLGVRLAELQGARARELTIAGAQAEAEAAAAPAAPAPEAEAEAEEAPRVVHVFDTTGRAAGARAAAGLYGPSGTLSIVGESAEPLAFSRAELLERPLLCTAAPHPDLLPELLARLVRGDLDLAPLCAPVGPAELEEALARLRRGQGPLCPLFVPDPSS